MLEGYFVKPGELKKARKIKHSKEAPL